MSIFFVLKESQKVQIYAPEPHNYLILQYEKLLFVCFVPFVALLNAFVVLSNVGAISRLPPFTEGD